MLPIVRPHETEMAMPSKTFRAKIVREGSMCFIRLTFDPKDVFGKVRAPVKVTLNGYSYRSTIAAMGGSAMYSAEEVESRGCGFGRWRDD